MIFIRHPEHTVLHRAIFNARRRPRTARATFRDDSKFLLFLLARRGDPFGARFVFLLVGHHSGGLCDFTLSCHEPRLSPRWSASFCHTHTSTGGARTPMGSVPKA